MSVIQPIVVLGFFFTAWICGIEYWARGAVWALACFVTGTLTGFLFGIPKVLQKDNKDDILYRQKVNVNLEEISNWLTHIIVGLGLIELNRIPGIIKDIGIVFAASVNLTEQYYGVFSAVVVFFLVSGFLFGYLSTRLYLQKAMATADQAVGMAEKTKDVDRETATDAGLREDTELPSSEEEVDMTGDDISSSEEEHG